MPGRKIHLLDVAIDNLTMSDALNQAKDFLMTKKFHHIVTPGPEFILEATANPEFQRIINQADLALPDGMGLHLGSRLTGQKLASRVPGIDFVEHLLALAATENKTVFLYGGAPGTAEKAARRLIRRYPSLRIVGIESGWRGPWQKVQDHRIVEKIHLAKPDIVLVALGFPKQEVWIDRHRHALHDVSIVIGVGRALEYLAGTIQRAPAIMRRAGLEWLHTYIHAGKYYQGKFRRQRVSNATARFLMTVLRQKKNSHD